jgi:tRNA threonylcarbamoyladenosine biosynthesis protein TsaE
VRLQSSSPGETKKIGKSLGRLLKTGDTVYIYGNLGAGKTVFIKGIASALGINERDIISASFTIAAEHEGRIPLCHIDLYRVEEAREIEEAGIYDYIGAEGITVIEWADRLKDIEDEIKVKINFLPGDKREIIIEGIEERDWINK